MIDFKDPALLSCGTPGLVVLDYMRNQAEQAMGNKPESSTPPGCLLWFLLLGSELSGLPSETDCDLEV